MARTIYASTGEGEFTVVLAYGMVTCFREEP
jgi:hypothetical protein